MHKSNQVKMGVYSKPLFYRFKAKLQALFADVNYFEIG